MQKTYLLLRNNTENGPFTLEELVQHELKASDLVWVNEESTNWCHPQDIKELQPHLSFFYNPPQPAISVTIPAEEKAKIETTDSRNVYVSLPADATKEVDAAAAGQNTAFDYITNAAGTLVPVNRQAKTAAKTGFSIREKEAAVADYLKTMNPKRDKHRTLKKVIIVVCLLASAAIVSWQIMESMKDVKPQRATIPQVADTAPATASIPVTGNTTTENTPPIQEQSNTQPLLQTQTQQETVVPEQPSQQQATPTKTKQPGVNSLLSGANKTAKVNVEQTTVAQEDVTKKLTDKPLDQPLVSPKEEKPVEEKRPEPKNDISKPESRAADLSHNVNVQFSYPANATAGIKDAKLTVSNRGAETIAQLTLVIQYYNSGNELKDEKKVSFGKLEAWKSFTVPLLDHTTANRLAYKIISAKGGEY